MQAVWCLLERREVRIGEPVADHHRPIRPGEVTGYVCAFCGGAAWPVEAPGRVSHFAHRRRGRCAEELAADPFAALVDRPRDHAAAKRLETFFKRNWRSYYRALDGESGGPVPYLHVREFLHMLDRAVRRDAFALRGLAGPDLARVLVTLIDFPPENGKWTRPPLAPRRRLWFRFWWYVPQEAHGDFWMWPRGEQVFFRGSFTPPPAGVRPKRDDLARAMPMAVPVLQLAGWETPLDRFTEAKVEDWFSRHPAFGRPQA